MKSRSQISRAGIGGALMVLSPVSLLFIRTDTGFLTDRFQLSAAAATVLACLICSFTLLKNPVTGKITGITASIGLYITALPYIAANPFIALVSTVLLISAFFLFYDFNIQFKKEKFSTEIRRYRQKAWWGTLMIPVIITLAFFLNPAESLFSPYIVISSLMIALALYLHWAIARKSVFRILFAGTIFLLTVILFMSNRFNHILSLSLVFSLIVLLSFPHEKDAFEKKSHWWEILLSHPARVLLVTFLGLCLAGMILLSLPVSAAGSNAVDLVNAAFTSVSAVCVTGLIVLDTPNDFSGFGQFCILLLIQLGGLGIMSITTVALHAMGKRLSLKQERLLTSMTDTHHKDLVQSLKTILKFTFITEGIGAVILVLLFCLEGDTLLQALWRGIFTAISAFCNAGFALQSQNLLPYQSNAFILHTVALLIILGGIAPATSLIIPRWLTGKNIPIPARITLVTTIILLFSGTFFLMAFEWNGILAGLSITDKINNAWFQSVTLRTAGFNSVDITTITSPTFMVMTAFMFIGGSPGGTAGGVKTTTIGILAMTFWANITNKNEIITHNRKIHFSTIYRAITIIISGLAIWAVVILMLQVTQQIPAGELIFEATSAIGTVGLSTGATALLDEIGKIIIIIAMFAGRIGPMTLFMLLSEGNAPPSSRCPEEKISLT